MICAAVHGQTASKINIVSVADAPFSPPQAFGHVKEVQMDTLRDVRVLDAPMVA